MGRNNESDSEEPCAARRLEGWKHHEESLPSFGTRPSGAPQDEAEIFHTLKQRNGYAGVVAGSMTARHSPKPMWAKPARSQWPRKMTPSPSSRNRRVSPVGNAIGSRPPLLSSRRLAQLSDSGPDTVPEPIRSPISRLQPLLVWWATIWATVQ